MYILLRVGCGAKSAYGDQGHAVLLIVAIRCMSSCRARGIGSNGSHGREKEAAHKYILLNDGSCARNGRKHSSAITGMGVEANTGLHTCSTTTGGRFNDSESIVTVMYWFFEHVELLIGPGSMQ
mgnify:CR=1 FL=1